MTRAYVRTLARLPAGTQPQCAGPVVARPLVVWDARWRRQSRRPGCQTFGRTDGFMATYGAMRMCGRRVAVDRPGCGVASWAWARGLGGSLALADR